MALRFAKLHKRGERGDKIGMRNDDNIRTPTTIVEERGCVVRRGEWRGNGVAENARMVRSCRTAAWQVRSPRCKSQNRTRLFRRWPEMLSGSVMSNTLNLRVAESGEMQAQSQREPMARKPIPIGNEGVGIVELDGLNDADVVVAIEGSQGDGIGAFVEERRFHVESLFGEDLADEFHEADGGTVEENTDAMILRVGGRPEE